MNKDGLTVKTSETSETGFWQPYCQNFRNPLGFGSFDSASVKFIPKGSGKDALQRSRFGKEISSRRQAAGSGFRRQQKQAAKKDTETKESA